tara:strand:+ start:8643 stop:8894 length:252 start_codon:yes stop_codon:yes gene_type:complete
MKMIIQVYHNKYIVTTDEMETIMDIVAKSECYTEKYHRAEGETESYYTYHVWWDGDERERSINYLSDATYNACKLVGKPTNDS